MAHRKSIQRFCRVLAALTVVGMIALPLIVLTIWLGPFMGDISLPDGSRLASPTDLSLQQRLAALAVTGVGVALQVAALWFLRRTFLEGAEGRWFSLRAVRSFRVFAWLSLILVFVGIVQAVAVSLIFSLGFPPGERQLSIAVGSDQVGELFGALLLLFVAHMFAEGRQVDEENATFI